MDPRAASASQIFSLDELNQAIWELLDELNAKPFQKLDRCRASAVVCFRRLDQYAVDACEVTGYVPRRGRRDQYALVAASQHLHAGGFSEEEIAQLVRIGLLRSRSR